MALLARRYAYGKYTFHFLKGNILERPKFLRRMRYLLFHVDPKTQRCILSLPNFDCKRLFLQSVPLRFLINKGLEFLDIIQ